MGKDIIIIGAGGLGREVLWLIEELNQGNESWRFLGFCDDNEKLINTEINGHPVLGSIEWLSNYGGKVSLACCVANPSVRNNIINRLKHNPSFDFPNLIADNVRFSNRVQFGTGNIICMSTTLTTDIRIGDFNIINPACTIGHDVVLHDFNTIYPGVNVSGNVIIGNLVELGTGSQIIQGLSICDGAVVGAGGVVIRRIVERGTYVGVPVKKVN